MRPRLSLLAAVSLVSTLAVTGCASGGEEAADEGASDLAVGSRLWSHFSPGDYDAAEDATLHIYEMLDRQFASVELDSTVTCSGGQLDIANGKAHVKNDSQGCAFDIERQADGRLRVHATLATQGTFDDVFAPRPDNALVGTYTAGHKLVVTITKSTSAGFTFSMVQTETSLERYVEYNKDSFAHRNANTSDYEFDGELGKLCVFEAKRNGTSYRLDFSDREVYQAKRCPYGYVAMSAP